MANFQLINIGTGPNTNTGTDLRDGANIINQNANVSAKQPSIFIQGNETGPSNGNINFVAANTSNMSIVAVQNTNPGNVTIYFDTLIVAGNGGGNGGSVTNVATGLGLIGGPITDFGTIAANIATTTVQGVTKLIDAINSTDTGNAATANAVNWAYNIGAGAENNAALAYGKANVAANSVSVYTNGVLAMANANLDFDNSATINVTATPYGFKQVNVAFSINASAINVSTQNANTTQRGVTLLIDSISSTDTANAPTANAVAWVNTVAQTALSLGAAAWIQSNEANISAQAGISLASAAYIQSYPSLFLNSVQNTQIIFSNGWSNISNVNVATMNGTSNLIFNLNGNTLNTWTVNVSSNTNTAALTVAHLANTTNLNVSSNIFSQSVNVTGNITVQNNIFVPNSSNIAFGGASGNIANANLIMTWNVTANSLDLLATEGGGGGTPGYLFGAQTNTGMYLVASNTIGFTCNANGVMNVAQGVVAISGSAANSPLLSFNVSPTVGSANATLTVGNVTNKPGGANSTVVWIPILANGVEYYIPAWGK